MLRLRGRLAAEVTAAMTLHLGRTRATHRPTAGRNRQTCVDGAVCFERLSSRCIHMRIAQVSPLTESVPPKFYGGTERVVAFLTDELVKLGHDVTLFASGDSETLARLVAM